MTTTSNLHAANSDMFTGFLRYENCNNIQTFISYYLKKFNFGIFFKTILTLFICLLLINTTSLAEEPAKDPVDLQKSFEDIKADFEKNIQNTEKFVQSVDLIDAKQKEFTALQIKLDECIATNTTALTTLKQNLTLLGDEAKIDEARDIKSKRKELNDQLQAVDNELKRCNLSKIQLKEYADEITKKRLNYLKKQLLSREISVFSAISAFFKKDDNNKTAIDSKPFAPLLEEFKTSLSWKGLAFIFLGVFIGWIWKRKESNEEITNQLHTSPSHIAIMRGLQRTAPILLGLVFLWIVFRFSENPKESLIRVVRFTFFLTLAFATFRGYLFPQRNSVKDRGIPRYRLLILVFFAIIYSVIAYLLNEQALGRFSNSSLLFFVWFGSLVISTISFILILQFIIRLILKKSRKSFYLYIPIFIMAAMLVAAFFGYRNLASLVFFGILLSMVTILFIYLIIRVSSEVFDSLDQGKIPWQNKLRRLMSIDKNRPFPGVLWLRMLVFLAALFVGISALITIWGGSQQPFTSLKGIYTNGIKIGSTQFDVTSIVTALLIMIVTLSLLPIIKNKLISGWLKHSNLSSGAKDATQTLVGYVVFALALLSALFILGMNFQNLAIVAGALSLGIGFGLQNIVNNFVSGLILLFERPIRRGDWIVVGTTEGYVRDISIRSTTIQTFDRADVIVPNSELIANQVTNWMLSSNIGRLKAAVGVAYGSDVNKVMEILNKIADDHQGVISHNDAYPTQVLFLAFGDSSLNFELRCFIRDIQNLMKILSEVNISIDAEFRKHNIEIPLPQRVIHTPNNEK